jgi:hypothetical protein
MRRDELIYAHRARALPLRRQRAAAAASAYRGAADDDAAPPASGAMPFDSVYADGALPPAHAPAPLPSENKESVCRDDARA